MMSTQFGDDASHMDPKSGVGCWKGSIRDKHFVILGLTICLLFFLIMLVLCEIGLCADDFFSGWGGLALLIVFAVFFSIESLCCSQTFQYLMNLREGESSKDYLDKLYAQAPSVHWHIQCYHYQCQTYMVMVSDGNDSSHSEIRTRQVRISTHSASRSVTIYSWKDISNKAETANLNRYQVTKLDLETRFQFDAHHEVEKTQFIANHNRDTYHEFSENQCVEGFTPHLLSLNDISKKSCFLHWTWYLLAQVSVIFAVPYRMWLSSISGKVHHTIVKDIYTTPYETAPAADTDTAAPTEESVSKIMSPTVKDFHPVLSLQKDEGHVAPTINNDAP